MEETIKVFNAFKLILLSLCKQRRLLIAKGVNKNELTLMQLEIFASKLKLLYSPKSIADFFVEQYQIIKLLPPAHSKKALDSLEFAYQTAKDLANGK